MTEVLVLCYHAVSESWDARLSVTPQALERQLLTLVKRGYAGATFERAVLDPPAPRTLAVTFDDAYRSVVTLARPILDELDLPATVFVPTSFAGGGAPMSWPGIDGWMGTEHEAELVGASWEELGELAADGWEIGSHTRTHPHLTTLDEATLAEELEHSRRECEEALGRPCRSIAYPYGDMDLRVVEAARRAGYTCAAALPHRLDSTEPLSWPRVGVYHRDDLRRFRLKVSPLTRRLRSSGIWNVIDATRRIVRSR